MLQQPPFLAYLSLLAVLPRHLGLLLQPFPNPPSVPLSLLLPAFILVLATTITLMDLAVPPESGQPLICSSPSLKASLTATLMDLVVPPAPVRPQNCSNPSTKASLTCGLEGTLQLSISHALLQPLPKASHSTGCPLLQALRLCGSRCITSLQSRSI